MERVSFFTRGLGLGGETETESPPPRTNGRMRRRQGHVTLGGQCMGTWTGHKHAALHCESVRLQFLNRWMALARLVRAHLLTPKAKERRRTHELEGAGVLRINANLRWVGHGQQKRTTAETRTTWIAPRSVCANNLALLKKD